MTMMIVMTIIVLTTIIIQELGTFKIELPPSDAPKKIKAGAPAEDDIQQSNN